MKKITIKEIARKAGVSQGLVSVVLNNKLNEKIFVSEEKRKKILEIVKKERYFPNKFAKALVTGKTNTIGVIVKNLSPYFSLLLENLQKCLFKKGYDIIPYVIEEKKKEKEKEVFEIAYRNIIDGIIITSYLNKPENYQKYSKLYNLKILTITPPIGNLPCVYFDEKEAGKIAAEYLIKTGCRKLCVAGVYQYSERSTGFVEVAKKNNLEVITLISNKGDHFSDGMEIVKMLFKLPVMPDGIFAFNDMIGAILISEINKRGLKIPDQISVIGCDNTQLCHYTTPNMTSIDTLTEKRAKLASEMIINLIEGKEIEKRQVILKPKIIVRESTKK